MMKGSHVTRDQLEAYVLDPTTSANFEEHFADCGSCREDLQREARFELALVEVARRSSVYAPAPAPASVIRRSLLAAIVLAVCVLGGIALYVATRPPSTGNEVAISPGPTIPPVVDAPVPPAVGPRTIEPIPQPRPRLPTTVGSALTANEIEQMAAKSAAATSRCFTRAGRNDPSFRGLHKVVVTIVVAPAGTIDTVTLSDGHQTDMLGKCLNAMIRGWRFRASPGGTFRFALVTS